MPNIVLATVSRAQAQIITDRVTPKVTRLILGDSVLFFWDGFLFAVANGEVLYFLDQEYAAGTSRFMNEFTRGAGLAQLRVSPRDFDFITGSTLTKLGLMLTRAPKEEK